MPLQRRQDVSAVPVSRSPDVGFDASSAQRSEPVRLVLGDHAAVALELGGDDPVTTNQQQVRPADVTGHRGAPAAARAARTVVQVNLAIVQVRGNCVDFHLSRSTRTIP